MASRSCTCGSSLLVAGVVVLARLLVAGPHISRPKGLGSVHVQ
nr:MAG TPA: hypothetical protein [Caudoviricetes sp.]